MARLYELMDTALKELGPPTAITLGPTDVAPASPDMVAEWRLRLLNRLEREADVHKKILLSLVIASFALFAVGIYLLLYHHNDGAVYRIVFGGTAMASMIAILNRIRTILADKVGFDLLIVVIPLLAPEQVVDIVKSLLYKHQADA